MIVNSRMENHNNLQQQIQINATNDCENFYLKRKYDSLILHTINDNSKDMIDNDEQSSSTLVYIQPKKRHLLNFTPINNGVDDTTITNESVDIITTTETTTKSLSSSSTTGTISTTVFNDNQDQHENDHHHQHPCEITTTYNLDNELDNSFANHCQNMADFLNYENTLITTTSPRSVSSASQSQSLQSSLSPSSIINHIQNPIYITSSSINDTTNWQNSDLLELDHRYNSINISNLNDNQIIQLDNNNKSSSPRQQHQHQQQQQQHQHQEQHQQQITMSTTTSQTDSDFEDKNLSWLFNFKLDELPNLSPSEVNRCSVSINNHSNNCNNKLSTVLSSSSSTSLLAANQSSSSSTIVPGTITTLSSSLESITTNRNQSSKTATGRKVDELILEVTSSECCENDIAVGENVIVENNTTRTPKKPPFTYTELIEYALEDKGELTVSGIYQWISDRFSFYKSNDDRWKNSVRHNLSINPHFRKGIKAPQGAGHLWTISSRGSEENTLAWEHKKQRLELFFRMENSFQQKMNNNNNNNGSSNNNTANSIIENQSESNNSAIYDEAATAAANIVQQLRNEENSSVSSPKLEQKQQQQQHHHNLSSQTSSINTTNSIINNHDHHHHHHESSTTAEQILTEISDEDLQKAAGEILNGVRRNVEVQSLETLHSSDISTFHDNLLNTGIGGDYLNPINKYDAVAESGLRHRSLDIANDFYVTEIDPIELGINMSNVEEEVLFSDEFNLNYFGINPNSDIVA